MTELDSANVRAIEFLIKEKQDRRREAFGEHVPYHDALDEVLKDPRNKRLAEWYQDMLLEKLDPPAARPVATASERPSSEGFDPFTPYDDGDPYDDCACG
jgi:hypothetical protein